MNTKRRKLSRRGAVMVEALIVAPVLLGMAMLGRYVYGVADDDLDALYRARESAWRQTVDGCTSGPWGIWNFADIGKKLFIADTGTLNRLQDGEFSLSTSYHEVIDLVIELLGGEDTKIGSADAKAPPGAKPGARSHEEVLMGCNERPHDLGTRRSGIEWVLALVHF